MIKRKKKNFFSPASAGMNITKAYFSLMLCLPQVDKGRGRREDAVTSIMTWSPRANEGPS